MHDLPVSHIEGTHHRRESAAKSKEMRPLLTHEPLPHEREKKPAAQPPRRRRRAQPTTPAFTFDPLHNHVPSGRQDPSTSQPIASGLASELLPTSYHEQPTAPVLDRETHNQFYDGRDVQKRPRIFLDYASVEHSTSPYPDSPCTDTNDMNSVPLATSDQPPCVAKYSVYTCPPQTPMPVNSYIGQTYEQPPVFHQNPYGYPVEPAPDRTIQNIPVQHFDATHGRVGLHGVPAYPESNVYSHTYRRC